MFKRYVTHSIPYPPSTSRPSHLGIVSPPNSIFLLYSGLARTFGRAAFARPTPVARLRATALPALSARFASSDVAQSGKIHQVIGAVVDGMWLLNALAGSWGRNAAAKIFSSAPIHLQSHRNRSQNNARNTR
jgi:hypothetical protein